MRATVTDQTAGLAAKTSLRRKPCCPRSSRRSAPSTSAACCVRRRCSTSAAKFARGEIDQAALTAAEDQAIKDALTLQERVGLKFATDGEFRRRSYHSFFYRQLGDLSIDTVGGEDAAKGGTPGKRASQPVAMIKSRVRWTPSDQRRRLRRSSAPTPGSCRRSPSPAPARCTSAAATPPCWPMRLPDLDQFWDDTVEAFGKELQALADAGCRYVQIDETAFAKFGDPEVQAHAQGARRRLERADRQIRRRHQPRAEERAVRHADRHASVPRQPRRPVALRGQLRLGRRPAVQRAQHSVLLPGIRLAARRHVHAAAARAAPQDRGARPRLDQDARRWRTRTS